jgi:hypothetical protein
MFHSYFHCGGSTLKCVWPSAWMIKFCFLSHPKENKKVMFHMGTYYNYFVFTLLYLGKALNYDSYMHRHVITLWCL